MNSTYGSSHSAFCSHHSLKLSCCAGVRSSGRDSPRSAWSSRLIRSGLPAIADSALYGDPSASWVGTSGSTCQTEQPAAARKSTKR